MYINFSYDDGEKRDLDVGMGDTSISTNETITIKGLQYGLGFEVDITDGKIKFLELVTHGEKWDGEVPDGFTFDQ